MTPWSYEFREGGGYDSMTDGFDILDAELKLVTTIDLFDYGQRSFGEEPESKRQAESTAALIVNAVNLWHDLHERLAPEAVR